MTVLICGIGHRSEIPEVVYGYPTPETFEAAEQGEVTIGGCMPDVPVERPCPTCGLPALSDPEWASRWASEHDAGPVAEGGERPR
jgi:hypothetical protein